MGMGRHLMIVFVFLLALLQGCLQNSLGEKLEPTTQEVIPSGEETVASSTPLGVSQKIGDAINRHLQECWSIFAFSDSPAISEQRRLICEKTSDLLKDALCPYPFSSPSVVGLLDDLSEKGCDGVKCVFSGGRTVSEEREKVFGGSGKLFLESSDPGGTHCIEKASGEFTSNFTTDECQLQCRSKIGPALVDCNAFSKGVLQCCDSIENGCTNPRPCGAGFQLQVAGFGRVKVDNNMFELLDSAALMHERISSSFETGYSHDNFISALKEYCKGVSHSVEIASPLLTEPFTPCNSPNIGNDFFAAYPEDYGIKISFNSSTSRICWFSTK